MTVNKFDNMNSSFKKMMFSWNFMKTRQCMIRHIKNI